MNRLHLGILPAALAAWLATAAVNLAMGADENASQPMIYGLHDADKYHPISAQVGGSITLAIDSDPKSFNSLTAKETSTTEITGMIYEGLARIHGISGEVIPNLADSWEHAEDGLTWTFHLRHDVLWNDGVPFTAADVEYTFNDMINNDDIPNSSRDMFTVEDKFPTVKALDDYTVQFVMPVKYAPFLWAVGQQSIYPKHISQPLVEAKKYASAFDLSTDPKDVVGTGPFMLERYEPAQRVVMKRNPNYWRKDAAGTSLPYLEQLIYVIVQDPNVRKLKFTRGETDYAGIRGQDYVEFKRLSRTDKISGGFTIYRVGPDSGSRFVMFNLNNDINPNTQKPYIDPVKFAWFSNVNFRKAVAYAMDRQGMIDVEYRGLGIMQDGPMGPREGYFFNPDTEKHPYDPEKAKQLLAQEGFTWDADGALFDPQDNRVSFILLAGAGGATAENLPGMICEDLRRIGMDVKPVFLQFNLLVTKLETSVEWDCMLMGLTGGPEPQDGANVWKSSGELHMWHPKETKPATEWETRIDEIYTEGVEELDRTKRKALYDEWQAIASDKLPLIYTILGMDIEAVRNRFGNMAPSAFGGVLWNLEEWYVLR